MKKLVIVIFAFVILAFLLIPRGGEEGKDLRAAIKEELLSAEWKSFQDTLFGYCVKCPAGFEVMSDSACRYEHYLQASLWITDVHIIHESYATFQPPRKENGKLSVPCPAIKGMPSVPAADYAKPSDTLFVHQSLRVPEWGEGFYTRHAKMVRSQKTWFVQSLIYPEGYDDVVEPFIRKIDAWEVW